ncbi:hypothetical protein D3C73_1420800 [compost metagenome]
MPLQLPGLVTLLPDHALQCLEGRGLAVFGDPAQQNLDDSLHIGIGLGTVLAHRVQLEGHVRALRLLADKRRQVLGGIGEQHIEHKTHRAGGAFDVSQNGFDGHALNPPGAGSGRQCRRR